MKPVLVRIAQAVELGDSAQLQSSVPAAAATDSLLSSSQQAGGKRNSLEDATLE